MAMTLITCHAVLVQMYGRKDTLIATCMIMSSLGANELTSSIAISDRKLHAGMVDQDPTGH